MKKNKIIIISIFLILCIVFGEILFSHFNKKEEKTIENSNPTDSTELVKRISCSKHLDNIVDEDTNITFSFTSDYAFYVDSNNKLVPDIYAMTYYFSNLNDLNTYYVSMANKWDISLTDPNYQKNEEDLTIVRYVRNLQGDIKEYSDAYVEQLKRAMEYQCDETEIPIDD